MGATCYLSSAREGSTTCVQGVLTPKLPLYWKVVDIKYFSEYNFSISEGNLQLDVLITQGKSGQSI